MDVTLSINDAKIEANPALSRVDFWWENIGMAVPPGQTVNITLESHNCLFDSKEKKTYVVKDESNIPILVPLFYTTNELPIGWKLGEASQLLTQDSFTLVFTPEFVPHILIAGSIEKVSDHILFNGKTYTIPFDLEWRGTVKGKAILQNNGASDYLTFLDPGPSMLVLKKIAEFAELYGFASMSTTKKLAVTSTIGIASESVELALFHKGNLMDEITWSLVPMPDKTAFRYSLHGLSCAQALPELLKYCKDRGFPLSKLAPPKTPIGLVENVCSCGQVH